MPVNYVAPSPVANEATMAGLLAPRYGGVGRGGGGGGGGSGGGSPWGQVIQLRGDPTAELQHRMNSQALGGAIAGNLALTERGTRLDLQQQGAELDNWLFNQRVTAQEAAQLRADERAIAAIRSDPTLSPAEQVEGIRRIQTRIDWVSERQKRDLLAEQTRQAKHHADLYKMQAELEEQRNVYQTAQVAGKLRFQPDKKLVAQAGLANQVRDEGITEQILDPATGQVVPNPAFARRIEELAEELGLGYRYATDKDGKPVLDKSSELEMAARARSGAGGGSGRGGSGRGDSGELGENQLATHAEAVMRSMDSWAKDNPGHTAEQYDAKLQQVISSHQKIGEALRESSPAAKHRKAVAAFKAEEVGKINEIQGGVLNRPDLSNDQKAAFDLAARVAKHLRNTYGPDEDMPPAIRARFKTAMAVLSKIPEIPPNARFVDRASLPRGTPPPGLMDRAAGEVGRATGRTLEGLRDRVGPLLGIRPREGPTPSTPTPMPTPTPQESVSLEAAAAKLQSNQPITEREKELLRKFLASPSGQ
jgi:hypothetical protein